MNRHRVYASVLAGLTVLCGGLHAAGCGGGGGGGGGGVVGGTTTGTLPGDEPYVLLDVRTGQPGPTFSMPQDGKPVVYGFPAVAGRTYTINIDTQPSGVQLDTTLGFLRASGNASNPASGTTPFQRVVSPTEDMTVLVVLIDQARAGLTVTASVTATPLESNTSSFTAVVHFAGDSYAGYGSFNDLATTPDKQAFALDLVAGINGYLASSGVQISQTAVRSISNATVQATQPQLVSGGRTIINGADPAASAASWGTLGMPGTDPQFGLALDIFVVHSTVNGNAAGQAAVRRGIQGGIFRGNGDAHAVVLSLFDATGVPQSAAITRYVGAHEIGHFLSLAHTTDSTLAFDPILDTPHAARSAYDLNGNNVFDAAEITNSANHPDFSNLLYPYLPPTGNVTAGTVSAAQGRAMQAYLAIREH